MYPRQFILGIVTFILFWALQAGYLASLGQASLFIAGVIFVIFLWIIGKEVMPNPPAENKPVWLFAILFAIIISAIASFVPPMYLGAVLPDGFTFSMVVPYILALWLVLFGGALFVTGQQANDGMASLVGIVWLFSALSFVVNIGPNAYIHFGLIAGLTFILCGLIDSPKKSEKKK